MAARLGHLAAFGHRAHLPAGRRLRGGDRTLQAAQHVYLRELAAGVEAALFQESHALGVILPGAGDEQSAPALRITLPQARNQRFCPGYCLVLDALPGVLGQGMAVKGRVLAQHGVANQPAIHMPQADVLVRVQVDLHHEEPEQQVAQVGVAPVVGLSPRLHQQRLHLPQIVF